MKSFLSLTFLILFGISPAFAKVDVLTLPSGHEIYSLPSKALPIAMVQLTFQQHGSVSDPKDKAGLAQMAAKMLMEGSGDYDAAAFRRALEEKAIDLSISAGRENITITLKSLTEHLPEALRLTKLMLSQPRFDEKSFTKIRSKMMTELKKASQNPNWIAGREFDKLAYGEHPYGQSRKGTRQSLKDMQRDDLVAWHKRLSSRSLLISIAGDVTSTAIKKPLMALINAIPSAEAHTAIPPAPELSAPNELVITRQTIPQSIAILGLPALPRSDPDFYAAYVMNHILGGGGLTSRLSQAIRQQRGLAYYAGSYLSPSRYSSILMSNFATRNEHALEAVKVAQKVLNDFAESGSTEAETKNAIDYLTGSFPLELADLSSQISYLTMMQRHQLGADYLEKRNDYFRAVTVADVNRIAAKMLAKQPLMLLVGDPKD